MLASSSVEHKAGASSLRNLSAEIIMGMKSVSLSKGKSINSMKSKTCNEEGKADEHTARLCHYFRPLTLDHNMHGQAGVLEGGYAAPA